MMDFGKWGMYSGKKYFFTLRNPKNGEVWSDDIAVKETEFRGKKPIVVIRYGAWIPTEKVKW